MDFLIDINHTDVYDQIYVTKTISCVVLTDTACYVRAIKKK